MRVTNSMMANNMLRNLTKNLGRMEKLQQKMASGKQFTRPSDDPIGVSRSLRLNTEVAVMEQYKRNADDVQSWLTTTEMAISNINDILQRAKELTVQAVSETNSINERNSIAAEISELRNQLIHIGNTTYAGSYIFSGFKTDKALLNSDGEYELGGAGAKMTLDEIIEANIGMGDRIGMNFIGQRIFGLYDSADESDLNLVTADTLTDKQSMKGKYLDPGNFPITGTITFNMTYNGATQTISFTGPIDDTGELITSISGALGAVGFGAIDVDVVDNKLVLESDTGEFSIDIGGATNIELIGLEEGQSSVSRIESGDKSQLIAIFDDLIYDLTHDDTAGISRALSRLENQAANINAIRAEIGVKSNRVELTTNRILDDIVNLQDLLSKNEDADMAEVIMNLKMEEYVYKASLSGGARIIQPTLIDFLR